MFTYAAPLVCPACRSDLPHRPEFAFGPSSRAALACPACAVPLDHPVAVDLVNTLRGADRLTGQLRRLATVPALPRHPETVPASPPDPAWPDPAFWGSGPVDPAAPRGVRASSVPRILLGLGALCLLVAAVAFLAVAWAWLGVAGRTTVLVGLTGLSAGAGIVVGRRRLRAAAEALTSVSLGLVLLDVAGAQASGWLGVASGAGLAVTAGLTVAAASGLLVALDRRLVAPQVVVALGLLIAGSGTAALAADALLASSLTLVALVTLAGMARVSGLRAAPWSLLAAAALTGLGVLALAATDLADDAAVTSTELWSGPGWALVLLGLALLSPRLVTRHPLVEATALAASASALTVLIALPTLDDGATTLGLASLALAAGWTTVVVLTHHSRRLVLVAAVPAGIACLAPAALGVALLAQAAGAALAPERSPRLPATDVVCAPWLLVPTTAVVTVLGLALLASLLGRRPGTADAAPAGLVLALAAVATVALHPAPLAAVVLPLAALALATAGAALARADHAGVVRLAVAGGLALASLLVAAPATALLCLLSALGTAVAAALLVRGRFAGAGTAGGALLPVALAGLLWTASDLVGADVAFRAAPILVVAGALAFLRPRLEVEVAAAVSTVVAATVAVPAATSVPGSLALHLTAAGAVVGASAVVHEHRRLLIWPAAALHLLALWVRLGDLGVTAPEAYSLPAAGLLLAAGLYRVTLDPRVGTGAALTPGLGAATVPSLVLVMAGDPVSTRALLLGLGCLALVLAGARLRWSAPLVAGAAVGTLLVLTELAPYAAVLPQWLVLGSAGLLLTAVGITWEHRMIDVRRASSALARLR